MVQGLFDEVIKNVGEPYKGGKGFERGTHEVVIGTVEAKEKDTKKAKGCKIIEVIVFDENDNDKTANCTLWFHTEGAAKMSVIKVLGIMVHNVGEEKKDKVRELGKKLFAKVTDISEARDVILKLMEDKMIGKKAFLVAEPSGDYPTTSYGDLWHYEAQVKGEAPTKPENLGENITNSVEANDVPEFEDL